jgi:2-phospho-L-lactate guanylyltransferase
VRAADLSRLVVVIPVRSLSDGKSRLGEPLDAEERASLVLGLTRRAVRAALESSQAAGVVVVSPDVALLDEARRMGAATLMQTLPGLNEGLTEARSAIAIEATALLVLPADLPEVAAAPIDRLIEVARASSLEHPGRPVVALVPDRHGLGTNALLVSPPEAIEFRFGEGSRAAHAEAARLAEACYTEVSGPLDFDVDTAEDLLLADLRGLDHESGR